MNNLLIIVIPLIGTLLSIFFAVWNTRQSLKSKAEEAHVTLLKARIEDLEDRMLECEKARTDLININLKKDGKIQELNQQNIDLLKRVVEEAVLDKIKEKVRG